MLDILPRMQVIGFTLLIQIEWQVHVCWSKEISNFPNMARLSLLRLIFSCGNIKLCSFLLQQYVLESSCHFSQIVTDADGNLVDNPDFLLFKQQYKLLASRLLSTVCDEILLYLINAKTSYDVVMTIERKFTTHSSIKHSSLRQMLYSQKKGQLSSKNICSRSNTWVMFWLQLELAFLINNRLVLFSLDL